MSFGALLLSRWPSPCCPLAFCRGRGSWQISRVTKGPDRARGEGVPLASSGGQWGVDAPSSTSVPDPPARCPPRERETPDTGTGTPRERDTDPSPAPLAGVRVQWVATYRIDLHRPLSGTCLPQGTEHRGARYRYAGGWVPVQGRGCPVWAPGRGGPGPHGREREPRERPREKAHGKGLKRASRGYRAPNAKILDPRWDRVTTTLLLPICPHPLCTSSTAPGVLFLSHTPYSRTPPHPSRVLSLSLLLLSLMTSLGALSCSGVGDGLGGGGMSNKP